MVKTERSALRRCAITIPRPPRGRTIEVARGRRLAKIEPSDAIAELSACFHRNGYVRRPNQDRRAAERSRYKKGYEVRLVAASEVELERIRSLLVSAGFEPGRPYAQLPGFRQPVYGREQVIRFLDAVGAAAGIEPARPARRAR